MRPGCKGATTNAPAKAKTQPLAELVGGRARKSGCEKNRSQKRVRESAGKTKLRKSGPGFRDKGRERKKGKN